jgi:hypothetical protein
MVKHKFKVGDRVRIQEAVYNAPLGGGTITTVIGVGLNAWDGGPLYRLLGCGDCGFPEGWIDLMPKNALQRLKERYGKAQV